MILKNKSGLYDNLKTDILMGYYEPGTKLKIEMLKKRYGMGVNVIRESLARLATEDLVDFQDQKGFRVAETSSARLSDLTRMRILLETDGVKHSIVNGGIDWETSLVAAHQKLAYIEEKMFVDQESHCRIWHQCDWGFHAALTSDCGSRLHCRYHQRIFDQFRQYVMVDLKTHGFRGHNIIEEHQAIVDAALARDTEKCIEALISHLSFYDQQQSEIKSKLRT